MKLKEHLEQIGACQEAINWVGDKTLAEAWTICARADWMLWLAGEHMNEQGWMTARELRLEACFAAEYALQFTTSKHKDILAQTIKVSRAFAEGKASREELFAAKEAATKAGGSAESAAWAAWAAAESAESAAWEAAWSAERSAAYILTQKKLADSIRIRWPKIGQEEK